MVLVSAALSFTVFGDGDLGSHLATGREVLASGRIPATNVLSYTNPAHPWGLHQWLPGVLFELAFRHGGALALQLMRVILVASTWLLVLWAARAWGASVLSALLATVLAACAAAFRFELRPYLFTHLALAAVLLAIARYAAARAASRPSRALLVAGLVTAVACHFHAGVLDAWIALAAFGLACACEPLRARVLAVAPVAPYGANPAVHAALALALGIGLACASLALYHPHGAEILLFPFDMASDRYLASHLIEFRSPISFPFHMLLAYFALLASTLIALALRARALHLFHFALVLAFALLSLRHVRLVYGFALVAAPTLALALSPWLERVPARARVYGVIALCAALLLQQKQLAPPGLGFAPRTFPARLFDFMAEQHVRGPAFVSDAWGGPLLGRFYPERKVFFDNRFEAYPRAFFRDVYQRIRYGEPGWDRLLDRYGVEIVLLRYTTAGEAALQHGKPNLRQHLAADPRYALLTFDDDGELFVRSAGLNAELASQRALRGLDPDRGLFLADPRAVAPALAAEVARGNDSLRMQTFAAVALLAAGDPRPAAALERQLPADDVARELYARLRAQLPPAPR